MKKAKLLRPFINGKHAAPASSTSSAAPKHLLINPATATPQTHQYHPTPSSQIQEALHCAKHAQRSWALESPSHRASVLRNAAHIMSQSIDLLGEMESMDTGRPIRETKYDMEEGVECLHYYAGVANSIGGGSYNLGTNLGYTLRE